MMIWGWLAAVVVFGIIEAATAGLVTIWFALGSVAALLLAVLDLSLWAQVIAFLLVSAVTLALTRPLVKRMTAGRIVPTNADRVLGEHAKVTETIDNENSTGAVYVDGKIWTARSEDGSVIPAGEQVTIEKMEGVRLFVKQSEKMEVVK